MRPERRGGAASEESPIGSGPFRWSSTSTENVVVVDRWEDYPDDAAPLLKQIEFHALSKSNERIQALIDDRIDIVNLSSPEFRWMVNGAFLSGQYSQGNPAGVGVCIHMLERRRPPIRSSAIRTPVGR